MIEIESTFYFFIEEMRVDSIFSDMTNKDDFILKCFSLFLTNKLAPGAIFVG